jgi:hypothetical protein
MTSSIRADQDRVSNGNPVVKPPNEDLLSRHSLRDRMVEHEPVEGNEFVYRRIHCTFYKSGLPIPIQAAAFRPNQHDTSGISVFRACFVQPADTLANVSPPKRDEYYVVRLAVRDLNRLGLTVVPEPDPDGPPGHAVIPELSWSVYQADRGRMRQVQLELATVASAAIVHGPSSL